MPIQSVTLKVHARCNLKCSYCYVYEKQDHSWTQRPRAMSDSILSSAVRRIAEHATRHKLKTISICFHGGEPTLVGHDTMTRWCEYATTALAGVANPRFVIQTNATRLTEHWIDLFRRFDFSVGISIDGLQADHDRHRLDFAGRGTHSSVTSAIKRLINANIDVGLLCVLPLGASAVETHEFLLNLGARSISYLLPDQTHDTVGDVRGAHGPTPCADFLIPIFDHWWDRNDETVRVRPFWSILRAILGGHSGVDAFGSGPLEFLFIETDGAIESLDVLRICGEGFANTGLNVLEHGFDDLAARNDFHSQLIFRGLTPPGACKRCPELPTCGGGYLPHRYSAAHGFENPSAWCADLLKLIAHMRHRVGIPLDETTMRRRLLEEMGCVAQ